MKPSCGAMADLHRRSLGSALAVVGFLLSPLSWWNDLFINVPLALVFAWFISLFKRNAFAASFVAGYWLTNIIGLALMQLGAGVLAGPKARAYGKRQFAIHLAIAFAYTGLIVALIKLKVLAPLPDYLPKR